MTWLIARQTAVLFEKWADDGDFAKKQADCDAVAIAGMHSFICSLVIEEIQKKQDHFSPAAASLLYPAGLHWRYAPSCSHAHSSGVAETN